MFVRQIPRRCNRRLPAAYDKEKYKQRSRVERLFNKLKGYRGVATRYDKLAAMFLGGVLAAFAKKSSGKTQGWSTTRIRYKLNAQCA